MKIPNWLLGPDRRFYLVIIAVLISKGIMMSGLMGKTWIDTSLWGCDVYAPCPDYFRHFTITNPEGWLWFQLNPFQYGERFYMAYVYLFDLALTAIQLKIRRIPRSYLMFHQLITMFAYEGFGHEGQNITILAIMPFMYLSPWIGIIPLLMKLPIGPWAFWNINDPHVQCALHCGGNYGDIWNFMTHFSNDYALMLCFLMPILFRYVYKKRNEKRV